MVSGEVYDDCGRGRKLLEVFEKHELGRLRLFCPTRYGHGTDREDLRDRIKLMFQTS